MDMRYPMEHTDPPSGLCNDESFGPLVRISCPRGADLTLMFQEMVLSLVPGFVVMGVLFIRMLGTRTVHWWPARKATTWKYWVKQVGHGDFINGPMRRSTDRAFQGVYTLHFLLASILVILRKRAQIFAPPTYPCAPTSVSFASDLTSASAASFLILNASIEMTTTSWSTSPRPITSYLLIGLISDLLRARTLTYTCTVDKTLGLDYLLLGLLKFMATILELFRPPRNLSSCVEDNSGMVSRLLFGWLYGTIRKGYMTRLQIEDLPPTKQSIRADYSDGTQNTMLKESFPSQPYSGSQFSLHREIAKTFCSSVATPMILRLLLLVTSIAQPMVIRSTLKFTESSQSNHGIFIVFGVILVYTGAAVLSGAYWHAVNSYNTRMRGLLFTIIYERALRSGGVDEPDSNGAMISLLSSDVDAVLQGLLWIHEIWATIATAAISMWMLYAEVGLA